MIYIISDERLSDGPVGYDAALTQLRLRVQYSHLALIFLLRRYYCGL